MTAVWVNITAKTTAASTCRHDCPSAATAIQPGLRRLAPRRRSSNAAIRADNRDDQPVSDPHDDVFAISPSIPTSQSLTVSRRRCDPGPAAA